MGSINIRAADGLIDYCVAMAKMFGEHGGGKRFELLARQEEKPWSSHSFEYGPIGNCYGNAAELALWRDGLHYVEGVALAGGGLPLPIEHAWCEDDEGRVIDLTWRLEDREVADMRYLGVRVPDELLRETLLRREVYGVLDDRRTVETLLAGGR